MEANFFPCMVSILSLTLVPLHFIPPSAGHLYCSSSVSVSLSPGSASVPPHRLNRTFIRETALLITELIFSLLSPIRIVNLKHCEFFKFSLLLSKGRGRKKDGNGGVFNRLSSLPGELDFSLFFFPSQQCKEI